MNAKPVNLAASVRQRLLTLAKARQDDFQRVLTPYDRDRFVARLLALPATSFLDE